MVLPRPDEPAGRHKQLSNILKAVRRRRGLRTVEVARAMGMPLRSYEHFESGKGQLNLERVHHFARAVDADPFAILLALDIRSPGFAVRCLDNKLATILVMALQDFDATTGDEIDRLDARSLITAFTRLFDDLGLQARAHEAYVERWMSDKALTILIEDAELPEEDR